MAGSGLIYAITFINMPGTFFKTPVPHQPYQLPLPQQQFQSATLALWSTMTDMVASYNYDPYYPLEVSLDLWSLDQNGADIEKVIANGDLPAWGTTSMSGTLHGFLTTGKLICGFRSAVSHRHGSAQVKLCPKVIGLIDNMQGGLAPNM